jgi:cytochrome c oxidase subunit 2
VTRLTLVRLIAAMLVVAAVMSVVLLQFDWFGPAASEQRGPIDTLFDVMVVLSSLMFSIVMVMLVYAVWRYRARPGDESDGEPIHGNTRLEIAWTLIPTVIVLFGAGYSWVVLDDIEAKEPDRMPIDVTAQQFQWTFEYPEAQIGGSGGESQYVTTHQLHVPVDRQIDFTVTALDVIHSFWVPEWGIKRDLVPKGIGGDDIDDEFVVTPDVEGSYSLVCTELCGQGHATMRAPVVVESQQDFDAWLADQKRQQTQTAGGGSAAAGSAGASSSGGGT